MNRPFIKLLETPNDKYFYDVNTNTFNSIEQRMFEKLNNKKSNKELEEIINQYNKEGLMLDKRVKELVHPNTSNLQQILNNMMSQMTLQITQQCNLRCEYCPYSNMDNMDNRNHTSKKMSWEVAKKAIDFLAQHTGKSEKVVIGFYGGEPLLEFELIKKIIHYANSNFIGKEVLYTITTNGTLLNADIAEFLYNNNANVLISLDGPKEIHDQHRRYISGNGSFDDVYSNLKRMLENNNQNWSELLSINMVIDPKNEFDDINLIAQDSLFENIQIRASVYDDTFVDEKIFYNENYTIQYTYQQFLEILGYLGIIDKNRVSPLCAAKMALLDINRELFRKKYQSLSECGCPSGPCVPGRKKVFVNTEGVLYPCEKVSEVSDNMKIGTLETGFDIEKIKKMINISRLTENQCKNCWAYRFCKSCIKGMEKGEDFWKIRKQSECANMLRIVENEMREYLLVNEYKQRYMEEII